MAAPARTRELTPEERAFAGGDEGRALAAIRVTACPPPAMLGAVATGALPDDLAAPVTAHLEGCAICRQLQADLLSIEPELDALEAARIRRRIGRPARTSMWRVAPFDSRRSLRAGAMAASVTIAVSGALLGMRAFDAGPLPSTPALARAATPPPSVRILTATKLEPRLDASLLMWRGADANQDFTLALANALKPYAANDFKAASTALERLGTRYPDRAEPALYLGICQLLMDRPVDAEKALRRAASIEGQHADDARWYLAVAMYQNGRRSESRQLLADMCRANGPRGVEACLARDQSGDTK